MTDFAERLYHRNRDPLHLVLDEADAFAPQRADPGGARLLGAIEDLVRRGRARGLGVTLITQRPAVLHKDVLTQAEVLVALRMTGPRDVAAIDEWVRLHADDTEAAEVKRSLPSLPVGTAWVWSPGWLGLLQRVAVRARRTFDSSATPKPGQQRVLPARMAPIDLAALAARLEATTGPAEPAGPADPPALRARVASLERELAATRRAPARVERVEVPALAPGELERLESVVEQAKTLAGALTATAEEVGRRLSALPAESVARAKGPDPPARRLLKPARPAGSAGERRSPIRQALEPAPGSDGKNTTSEAPGLKAGARRMLDTLARHHPVRVTRAQLATLSRFTVTGGTFATYYSALRRAGLITESDGLIGLTDAGRARTGVRAGAPASTQELLGEWRSALKAGARTMLDLLVAAHPRPLTREELAAAAGYEVTGGTYSTYLSTLRRNGLVTVDADKVRAADVLFLADQAEAAPR